MEVKAVQGLDWVMNQYREGSTSVEDQTPIHINHFLRGWRDGTEHLGWVNKGMGGWGEGSFLQHKF